MRKQTFIKWLAIGGGVLSLALWLGDAWASNMIAPSNSCTGINCSARAITGTTLVSGSGAHPWVGQIFTSSGRCLRIAQTSGNDNRITVTAPNGTTWRNDDNGEGSSCSLCPVVKISNTPLTGWYTVTVNQYLGSPQTGNFTMFYSMYPVGNSNCANATPPVIAPPGEHSGSQKGASSQDAAAE